jgi:hypothetical protein
VSRLRFMAPMPVQGPGESLRSERQSQGGETGSSPAASDCLKAATAADNTMTMRMSGFGDYAKRESARAHLNMAEQAVRAGDAQRGRP